MVVVFAGLAWPQSRATGLPYHAYLPALAGDSASGSNMSATSTPTPPPGATCGSGHLALLGFGDAGAGAIDLTTDTTTTLGQLRTLPRPADVPTDATRSSSFETTLFSLSAPLVSMSQRADGTIVVLAGGTAGGATIPLLLPPRGCTASAAAAQQGAMNGAIAALRIACGDPPRPGDAPHALSGSATVTGTGLWLGFPLEGMPPNGAALGPLLSFTFSGASCNPADASPTPSPTPAPVLRGVLLSAPGQSSLAPVPAGQVVSATVSTEPPSPGVTCAFTYVSPPVPPDTVGVIDNDPALAPKTTGPDGTATWTWTIPSDSVTGSARAEVQCGPQIFATARVYIG